MIFNTSVLYYIQSIMCIHNMLAYKYVA